MEEKDILTWVIEEYGDNDYLAWELELPAARRDFWQKTHQLNQTLIDKSGCVYHAWIGCILDQQDFNEVPYINEIQDIKGSYGYTPKGMYIYKGVDMVRHLWNSKNPNDTIISYSIPLQSDLFRQVLDLGYSVWTWYLGNRAYNIDKADRVLNWNNFKPTTYGHSVRITKKDDVYIVDNYYNNKPWDEDDNVYKLQDLEILKNNYFKNGYILIFKNEIEKMNNPDIQLIETAIAEWITNDASLLDDVRAGKYHPELRNLIRMMRVRDNLLKKINKA